LFGCPCTEDGKYDVATVKAQNVANRAKNSKFALAVIQTLLDTSVNNYQYVLSVPTPLFSFPPLVIFTISLYV